MFAWSMVDFATVPTCRGLVKGSLHSVGPPTAMVLCVLNRERLVVMSTRRFRSGSWVIAEWFQWSSAWSG